MASCYVVCQHCGSAHVHTREWVDQRTGDAVPDDHGIEAWCVDCEELVDVYHEAVDDPEENRFEHPPRVAFAIALFFTQLALHTYRKNHPA